MDTESEWGQIQKCREVLIKQWRRRRCYSGRRRGYSPQGWSGPWIASTTRSRDISTGGNRGNGGDETWEYPPLEEAMGEAGLEGTRKSVTRRQNMVQQYIATRPILDLCERVTRRPGVRVYRRWWEQAGIDLEGERYPPPPYKDIGKNQSMGKELVEKLTKRETESSDVIAVVLGRTSTTQQ